MENILEIKNLEFTYPKKNKTSFFLSLDSFELDFGEKTAFVSPNGSGKTTLVNLILGITLPKSGAVLYKGSQISRKQRKEIAFLSPMVSICMARLTLLQNLKYSASFWGCSLDLLDYLIEKLGMQSHLNTYFDRLSSGFRMRCLWAMELLKEPDLILLDEAFRSVDQKTEDQLLDLLEDLNSKRNTSVLFFEPKFHSHLSFADNFFRLEKGKLMVSKKEIT